MSPRQHDPDKLTWQIREVSDLTVDIGGTAVPRTFVARLQHPDWPAAADLKVTVTVDRGPVASGLAAVPSGAADVPTYREMDEVVTSTMEQRRLLKEVTADAVSFQGLMHLYGDLPPLQRMDDETRAVAAARMGSAARATGDRAWEVVEPRRRRLLTRDHLGQVAETYRHAMEQGRPPTQAVADAFHISHSNASKWVKKARDAGALGPARGPRPGEAKS